jgi:hypothetical protein
MPKTIESPKISRREGGQYLRLRLATRNLLDHIGIPSNPGFLDHNIVSDFRERLNLKAFRYSNNNGLKYLKGDLIKTINEAGGKIDDSASVESLVAALEKLVATEIADGEQEED